MKVLQAVKLTSMNLAWKPKTTLNLDNVTDSNNNLYFDKFYPILAILTIIVYLIFGTLSVMITFYERFGMDSQKRGLQNRVSK